nr:uncharacterized protein LOC129388145 isoform X1 [Dermacentor andersoni]
MSTPYGRYRFLRMPFGISSAPEIFQAAMHRLLDGLPSVAVVMDDILVWGKTKDEHDCNLTLVLTRCREHNLRLNLKKCTFLQAEVRYLGHILTTQGLRIDPERVQDILEIPEPKTKTAWPEHKHGVPEPGRPYWTYREEVHAQDGLVFRSNKRLMGRQTRTLLPVPTIHLEPEAIPSKEVHDRLQTIRRRQKIHYDRSARNLSPLTPGQRVTTYDTLQRTWAPAIVLRPAATPRSTIVKTEDGHEIRRTREHLREAAPQPEPESTSQGPSEDDLQPGQQQLRRSTRLRREPCRYPLRDETSRPYHH